jgi:hypothetical protein
VASRNTLFEYHTDAGRTVCIPHEVFKLSFQDLSSWTYVPFFSCSGYPAGLWRMSARSLSIFLRIFINNGSSLLTSQSIAEMKTVVGGGLIPLYEPNSDRNITNQLPSFRFGISWHWRTLRNGHRSLWFFARHETFDVNE